MMNLILRFSPIITAFAKGEESGGTMQKIVQWAGGIACGVVALFLIISIAKDAFGIATGKGDSSVFKVIGKVLFLILMIGLITVSIKYDDLMKKTEGIAKDGLDIVASEVDNMNLIR